MELFYHMCTIRRVVWKSSFFAKFLSLRSYPWKFTVESHTRASQHLRYIEYAQKMAKILLHRVDLKGGGPRCGILLRRSNIRLRPFLGRLAPSSSLLLVEEISQLWWLAVVLHWLDILPATSPSLCVSASTARAKRWRSRSSYEAESAPSSSSVSARVLWT